MKFSSPRRASFRTPMTAMIDVVFLLLVFFVWTASFQVEEQLLPSSLAAAAGVGDAKPLDVPAELETVIVAISKTESGSQWAVNGRALDSFQQLQDLLATVAGIGTEVPVIIDPQANVPLAQVVRAYDVARAAGFDRVHFAVE
jgi:biopolymer transport protein ExbD